LRFDFQPQVMKHARDLVELCELGRGLVGEEVSEEVSDVAGQEEQGLGLGERALGDVEEAGVLGVGAPLGALAGRSADRLREGQPEQGSGTSAPSFGLGELGLRAGRAAVALASRRPRQRSRHP
jgi:hypothetical protein